MYGTVERTPARELSVQEHQERAGLCSGLDQGIKASLRAGREAVWEASRLMHLFDEQQGWTALGYESLSGWLADPDVDMSRTTFYRMVGRYREMALVRSLPEAELKTLEPSKVDIVLPTIKQRDKSLDDVLVDVRTRSASDLRERYSSVEPKAEPDPNSEPPETEQQSTDKVIAEPPVLGHEPAVPVVLSQAEAVGFALDAIENRPEAVREALANLVAATLAPTEGEWRRMQQRAIRRRKPLRFLAATSGWELVGDETERTGWQVPVTDLDRRHV